MKRFRSRNLRNKKLQIPTNYLLLILSGLCITALMLGLTLNISGGPLNKIAGYVFVPMQEGMNSAGRFLSDKTNDFRTLGDVLEENEKLKAQVDELTVQLTNTKLDRYELDNFRQLYALDEKYPEYEKVAATVIARDAGNWFDTFTINRGKKHGIEKGMNVIAGSGLVGIITEVGDNYAKVRSIINDTSNVSAMISSTRDIFNVSGNLQSMGESNTITFSELKDKDDQVQAGAVVVTSYVSDQYQPGILIGYISSVTTNSNHLTKSGTITPAVDFEHIQEVLVILEKKDLGENPQSDNTSAQE